MSSIRKQLFLICQCLGLSRTSPVLAFTCRVLAQRRSSGFGVHPRHGCAVATHLLCTKPDVKGRQLLMPSRTHRE